MPLRLQAITILATEATFASYLVPEGTGAFDVRAGLTMTVATDFDVDPLAVLSTENGRLTFDPDVNDGVFSLDIPQPLAASWPARSYVYVLTGIEDGLPREICRGAFVVIVGGRTGDDARAQALNLRETVNLSISSRQSCDFYGLWRVFDGEPVDLMAYLPILTVRPTFDHPTRIVQWKPGAGLERDANGFLRLGIAQATGMALVPAGSWCFILAVSGQRGVFELARGPFDVFPGTV